MKVGLFIGKVKKFGISWCFPHRMAADNAKGGSGQTPPAPNRVKLLSQVQWINGTAVVFLAFFISHRL